MANFMGMFTVCYPIIFLGKIYIHNILEIICINMKADNAYAVIVLTYKHKGGLLPNTSMVQKSI